MSELSVLDEAILFATRAHCGQVRKFGGTPYILHPMEVAAIIATMSDQVETMAAGALHDTIEDCGVQPEEIMERFGRRVFGLVQSETEDKMPNYPPEVSWLMRKQDSLEMLKGSPDREVRVLWLADKLSNLRSFYRNYLAVGDAVWENLHQKDPAIQGWYYRSVAECMFDLKDTAAYREYVDLINKVFGEK